MSKYPTGFHAQRGVFAPGLRAVSPCEGNGCAKITVLLQKSLLKQHLFLPTLSLKHQHNVNSLEEFESNYEAQIQRLRYFTPNLPSLFCCLSAKPLIFSKPQLAFVWPQPQVMAWGEGDQGGGESLTAFQVSLGEQHSWAGWRSHAPISSNHRTCARLSAGDIPRDAAITTYFASLM